MAESRRWDRKPETEKAAVFHGGLDAYNKMDPDDDATVKAAWELNDLA